MADEELRALVNRARRIAAAVGPQLWDVIFDAEAALSGRPSIVPREDIEQELLETVGRR